MRHRQLCLWSVEFMSVHLSDGLFGHKRDIQVWSVYFLFSCLLVVDTPSMIINPPCRLELLDAWNNILRLRIRSEFFHRSSDGIKNLPSLDEMIYTYNESKFLLRLYVLEAMMRNKLTTKMLHSFYLKIWYLKTNGKYLD